MTLGQAFTIRLNELLKERNITLHKFLKESCIPRSTIINIALGNTKSPNLALIYQVAEGFGVSYLEFIDCEVFKRKDLEFYK